jgi:hypothetical protein
MKLYIRPTDDGEIGPAVESEYHSELEGWLCFERRPGFIPASFYITPESELRFRGRRPSPEHTFDRTSGAWIAPTGEVVLKAAKLRRGKHLRVNAEASRRTALRAFGFRWRLDDVDEVTMRVLAARVSDATEFIVFDFGGVPRVLSREQLEALPGKYVKAYDNIRAALSAKLSELEAASTPEEARSVSWQEL